MKVEGITIAVDGATRASFDIARDFVREQSRGEWTDDQIYEDAVLLSRVLCAFRDAHRPTTASDDNDAHPIDLPDLYRRVRRLEEKVLP